MASKPICVVGDGVGEVSSTLCNTSTDAFNELVARTEILENVKVVKDPELLKIPFRKLTFTGTIFPYPKLKEIMVQSQKWAEKFPAFQQLKNYRMNSRAIFLAGSYMAAGNFYDMPDSFVQCVTDFIAYAFFFDDLWDNCNDVNTAKFLTDGYYEVLLGDNDALVDEFTKNEFFKPALDLRNRCPLNCGQRSALRNELKLSCDAVYQICEWQIKQIQPDLDLYSTQRGYDAATNSYTMLGIVAHDYPNYRKEDWDSEELKLMKLHSYRYIAIVIDLALIHKEEGYYKRRMELNTVVMIKRSKSCSWKEALDITYDLLEKSEQIATAENDRLKGKYSQICFEVMQMVHICVDYVLQMRNSRYK